MRFEYIDERHADHRNPLTWSLLTGIRPRRQGRIINTSQAHFICQLRKQGDSTAEIAREVEASRSTVRNHLAKNDLSHPGHPSVPLFALGASTHATRQSRRLRPAPTGTEAHVRHVPLTQANPTRKLLGGFAGRTCPKRHPVPAFPQVSRADSEQPSPKTAQKSRTHGEIGTHFLQNRPKPAGARPRTRPRQPQTPTRAQPTWAHLPTSQRRTSVPCSKTLRSTTTPVAALPSLAPRYSPCLVLSCRDIIG